jgi:hypothetical protein
MNIATKLWRRHALLLNERKVEANGSPALQISTDVATKLSSFAGHPLKKEN